MRLTPKQQQIIVTTLRRYFGQSSRHHIPTCRSTVLPKKQE
jgi:hypothetical protein